MRVCGQAGIIHTERGETHLVDFGEAFLRNNNIRQCLHIPQAMGYSDGKLCSYIVRALRINMIDPQYDNLRHDLVTTYGYETLLVHRPAEEYLHDTPSTGARPTA